MAAAAKLNTVYMAYVDAGDEHNPHRPHRRGQFMAMTSAYRKFAKRLASATATLNGHADNCNHLQAQVAGAADTRAAIAELISAAREIVGTRRSEGWQVNDSLGLLTQADHWLLLADESLAATEHLTMIDRFGEAQTLASQAHDLAQDLPARQKRILDECDDFMRRAGRVPSAIARARAALLVVAGTYAEVCSSSYEANLVAAEALRSGIAAQVTELRRLVQPEISDWEEADALSAEIDGDLADIERECTGIRGLKERLDGILAQARRSGRELYGYIGQVEANALDRDGDQRNVLAALSKVSDQLDTVMAAFGQPRPNPTELADTVDQLSNLIERIDGQSQVNDEGDDDEDGGGDDIIGSVLGAVTIAGLDIFFGN